jgi:hypothetical protein
MTTMQLSITQNKKRIDLKAHGLHRTGESRILDIHLDNLPAVFPDAKDLTIAWDWSIQGTYYLKEEIAALEERLEKEDPDCVKTSHAEWAEKERKKRFGNLPVWVNSEGLWRDPWVNS